MAGCIGFEVKLHKAIAGLPGRLRTIRERSLSSIPIKTTSPFLYGDLLIGSDRGFLIIIDLH